MRVLVGCEVTGTVRDAFLAAGHDAVSCDIQASQRPGPHIQGDLLEVLRSGASAWDLLIAHPPCQYLSCSGLHWNKRRPERAQKTEAALEFVRELFELSAAVPRVAIENPHGCISTRIRPYTQVIQPYHFGNDASKATCLWLRGLPPLRPTGYIAPRWVCCGRPLAVEVLGKYGCPNCCGDNRPRPRWANQTDSGQNRLPPSAERAALRAATYPGIAAAMVAQWGAA